VRGRKLALHAKIGRNEKIERVHIASGGVGLGVHINWVLELENTVPLDGLALHVVLDSERRCNDTNVVEDYRWRS